jgi:hypothetical protein
MVRKYYDFQFEMKVDGEPCAPERVSPLFQVDPFPGGHQYTCVISGHRLVKYFSYLQKSQRKVPSQDEAFSLLSLLGLVWTEGHKVPLNYFLNSIEELILMESGCAFAAYVRQSPNPKHDTRLERLRDERRFFVKLRGRAVQAQRA